MIKELSVKASATNRRAHVLCISFLIVSALLFTTRFIIDRYQGIVDIFTIGFITAAVFLYTKYISSCYYYDTMITTDGEPIFVVRKATGKRASTMCRISFAEILSVKKETREEFRSHKTPRGTSKYLYTPTYRPEKVYRIEMRSAYERAEIVIECSDEFADCISEWAKEARANRFADEEY